MLEQILETTKELIRFRSTATRPEILHACADYVANFFADTSLHVEKVVHNNIPSILVTKNTKEPKVVLCGHFDVVDGIDEQFEPTIDGDIMKGRGAFDMKSGVATMMHIMKELAGTNHDVGLYLTGDEEIGGNSGVAYILNELGYKAQIALIPDGGNAVHKLIIKEKGILRVVLKAEGKSAHAAYLWRGDNAIDKLREALDTVQRLFLPVDQHPEDHWATTFNVGEISGGLAFNMVPKYAKAHCDIRVIETEKVEEIVQRIAAVLPEGVTYQVDLASDAAFNPPDHPLLQPFVETVKEHGREPEFFVTHGASDGRFFAAHNIPVIMCQPDGGDIHEEGEWVSIEGIKTYYEVVKDYLDKVAR